MKPNIIAILTITDIFDSMTHEQLELIASISKLESYQDGDILLRENENSDEIYAIARGTVEILMNPGFVGGLEQQSIEPVVLTELRQGQVVGEVALVDQGVRSATARVSRKDTLLLRIPRHHLMELCETNSDLGFKLMKNLAADLAYKIRNTDLTIRQYQLMLSHSSKDES